MNRVRPYLAPLAVYLATRVLAALFVVLAAPGRSVAMDELLGYHTTVPARLPADYGTVMTSWDGQWYWQIVLHGYPSSAVGPDGVPVQTALAFFPLYPTLVGGVMRATGLGFAVVAPTLSLVIGAAAILVVFRLLQLATDRGRALAAITLLCCFASAPILQAAYTESLGLLLVASALLLLLRRRYLWALLPVVLLGVTRNITLVLAPVVALHWLVAVRGPHRDQTPVPHWRIGALLAATVLATAEWPLLVGLLTGESNAYFTTLGAWPGFTGSPLNPPWLDAVRSAGPVGIVVGLALVALFVALVVGGPQRAWGPELWGWTVSYSAYIFLAAGVSGSVIRYLLLDFPFALVLMPQARTAAERRSGRVVLVVFVLAGLVSQYLWVSKFLVYSGPEGGWGFP